MTTSLTYFLVFMSFTSSQLYAQDAQKTSQSLVYIGTYEGERNITKTDSGALMYQRVGAPIALKLIKIENDFYELEIPSGVRAPLEIPKIEFIKNETGEVTGILLVYKDGRKDGPYKKIEN